MGRIESKAVHTGLNNDLGTYRDDRYVRCARCGFICHLDRDRRSRDGSREGWGITYAVNDTAYNDANVSYDDMLVVYNDSNLNNMDPVVTAGCPQCGCMLYDK